jgi:hypothetical protein
MPRPCLSREPPRVDAGVLLLLDLTIRPVYCGAALAAVGCWF